MAQEVESRRVQLFQQATGFRQWAGGVGAGLWEFTRRKPLGAFGAATLILVITMAVFAPLIQRTNPHLSNVSHRLEAPSSDAWLGTDRLRRDVYSRIIAGSRVSVSIGFFAVAILTVLAVVIGIVSAYYRGAVDGVLQRFVDAVMALPTLPILIAASFVLGPSILTISLLLGFLSGPSASRVVRGAALSIRENQYIEAERALGASDFRIIFRHILPNVMAPVMVIATVFLGVTILAEAALNFLGVGLAPPTISWGGMLTGSGLANLQSAPWLAVAPGAAIAIIVFGINVFGDALRDVLDPRLRGVT